MTDFFIFNGELNRGADLQFAEMIFEKREDKDCVLVLVTPGGSPDAAYKMGRYLQSTYESFTVLIPGLCKSAGTLLAIAANEIVITPYGELGPLDIQMAKEDKLQGMESGLNISEAFHALENRATDTYHRLVAEIFASSGGRVSFQTASHSAAELVSSMFGPIFGSIDPEEVGSRTRAMRIGEDYGYRLNIKSENLAEGSLEKLSQSYSSHGFVIDFEEASRLFNRVRSANDVEKQVVNILGESARHPQGSTICSSLKDVIDGISSKENESEAKDVKSKTESKSRKQPSKPNGPDSAAPV